MKKKYENVFEGIKIQGNQTLLNRIYTQLYILEGESEGINKEHEVLQMEQKTRKHLQDIPIDCNNIFKLSLELRFEEYGQDQVQKLRTVLTKGIAGIGKTVSVQKFILDWAEGKTNQDIEFMFVLPFRELNLIKDKQYSLHGLLCDFNPELRDLDMNMYNKLKGVFIFDGLDESKIQLNFSKNGKVHMVSTTSSVHVLMTNLIKGDLFPSAHIWITSRPAAANQIPSQYISRVTEIQGFNDSQKEEYFRKGIADQDQAKKIISHIKTTRSLHIMCHIPVFCWISANVFQNIGNAEIPKTLTEMYIYFLLTQTNMKKEKYENSDETDSKELLESNREVIRKLSELAFKQLMKGNVMFYEDDLRECGIDVTEASVYSGICTEIFREESVLYQRKVYCFVHLSFQEFLAAFYVFYCYVNNNKEELIFFKPQYREWSENLTLEVLLEAAVQKALQCETGHLDLFLRFLLGISLESNQKLLKDLLINTQSSSESIKKTISCIKKQIKSEEIDTEKSINLFLCLSEMKDQSLPKEIQECLKSEKQLGKKLSLGQCSALACMLLTAEEELDELNLKKYNTTEEGYRRLIPAVSNCRKAILSGCNLTTNICELLTSALQSTNSSLKVLDLSNNMLQDSGVEKLSSGLNSSQCKLEILRIVGCNLTTSSCKTIGSTLKSENSSLTELDIRNNNLQDSGLELLSEGLRSLQCKLKILRLDGCNLTKNSCEALCSVLTSANSSLKELSCDSNDLQDSGVEKLSAGLKSSNNKLEILRLAVCNLTVESCKMFALALQSANVSLKELDLSNNDLQDSGVELLSVGLKSSHCKLEILRLSGCMITEKGCSCMASVLSVNPSHLKELDLTYNHPGDRVKLLTDKLDDPQCRLDILSVEHSGKYRITQGFKKYACDLTLDSNTVHTRLSLSERNKKVKCVTEQIAYPDHPERFDWWWQVLCKQSLTGRCYWEAEWSGKIVIALTYKTISRKGDSGDCQFGYNEKSWRLSCSNISYSVWYNKKDTVVPVPPSSSNRVGVYVDCPAGILSFYSISTDTHKLTHLYTFHSAFTEPLYAGFRFYDTESSVSLCDIV
ncbi:NACHT, LRR and PYD domains-containing protein 3-like isoform X3 [Hoplias malabaricus]|uniref:NACHT, LRR and PYD domains-containing protein 3-like isoform X3 n=1 Tax=Hoplias malabaricus TaxID=27720 RepID=UPI00346356A5